MVSGSGTGSSSSGGGGFGLDLVDLESAFFVITASSSDCVSGGSGRGLDRDDFVAALEGGFLAGASSSTSWDGRGFAGGLDDGLRVVLFFRGISSSSASRSATARDFDFDLDGLGGGRSISLSSSSVSGMRFGLDLVSSVVESAFVLDFADGLRVVLLPNGASSSTVSGTSTVLGF